MNTNIIRKSLLLFLLACFLKIFYIVYQQGCIIVSDEMPGSYSLAKNYQLKEIVERIFFQWDSSLGSARPFFTSFLYAFAFKIAHFHPWTALCVGVIVGSAFIPIYYLMVAKLFESHVAFLSAITISLLPNYIEQSISLTTILPGVFLIFLSILLAAVYYARYEARLCLYLSGFFVSLSTLCRYENVLFIPFFIIYNFLFDKKSRFYQKLLYSILCISGVAFILLGNFKHTGNPFHFFFAQLNISSIQNLPFLTFSAALAVVFRLLNHLLLWPVWVIGLAAGAVIVKRYKARALVVALALFIFFCFLFYKIKKGTIFYDENYFLVFAFMVVPSAFFLIRLFLKQHCRNSFGASVLFGIALVGLLWYCHARNLSFERIGCPKEYFQIIEKIHSNKTLQIHGVWQDTKENIPFYICSSEIYLNAAIAQTMLYYLGLDSVCHLYENAYPIQGNYFFILIAKNEILEKIKGKAFLLLADYGSLGLYRIDNTREGSAQ